MLLFHVASGALSRILTCCRLTLASFARCCWSHVLASSVSMISWSYNEVFGNPLIQIVVGSIAIRHPRWALAVEATQALDLIWQQLRKVACTSDQLDRPLKALVSHAVTPVCPRLVMALRNLSRISVKGRTGLRLNPKHALRPHTWRRQGQPMS